MKILKENVEYQGTPEEIYRFMSLGELTTKAESTPEQDGHMAAPLENLVSESERLRQELARDINYNPFGGVVPSRETEQDINPKKVATAEENTGVELI